MSRREPIQLAPTAALCPRQGPSTPNKCQRQTEANKTTSDKHTSKQASRQTPTTYEQQHPLASNTSQTRVYFYNFTVHTPPPAPAPSFSSSPAPAEAAAHTRQDAPVVPVKAEKNAAQEHGEGRLFLRVQQRRRHHAPDAVVERRLAQHPVLRHRHQRAAYLQR